MPRPRDSQRSKLYAWERANVFGLPTNTNVSLDEAKRLVEKICRKYRKAVPAVLDGRGRRNACGTATYIKLPVWARTKAVVCHEVSHSILTSRKLVPWHGPDFVRLYIDTLVSEGVATKRDLLQSARAAGLKVAGRTEAVAKESWLKDLDTQLAQVVSFLRTKYGVSESYLKAAIRRCA